MIKNALDAGLIYDRNLYMALAVKSATAIGGRSLNENTSYGVVRLRKWTGWVHLKIVIRNTVGVIQLRKWTSSGMFFDQLMEASENCTVQKAEEVILPHHPSWISV